MAKTNIINIKDITKYIGWTIYENGRKKGIIKDIFLCLDPWDTITLFFLMENHRDTSCLIKKFFETINNMSDTAKEAKEINFFYKGLR